MHDYSVMKVIDGSIIYDFGAGTSEKYAPLMDLAVLIAQDEAKMNHDDEYRYSSTFVSMVFVRLVKHIYNEDLPTRWK